MACLPCRLLAGLCLFLPVTGCSVRGTQCSCCYHTGPTGRPPELLPLGGRAVAPDELAVPPLSGPPPESLGVAKPLPCYRRLGARECQCLAATTAVYANLLALEQEAVAKQAGQARSSHRKGAVIALKREVLALLAAEDRNRWAGQALDSYYRLGEAEASWDIVQLSLSHVQDALGKARDLKAKGLESPVDESQVYRQQLDLQAQGAQLQEQIQQFNGDLHGRLGFNPCGEGWRVWPAEAFSLPDVPPDEKAAVSVGLESRPELVLLNLLEKELNAGNLDTVRQLLRSLNGMLGQSPLAALCPKLQRLLSQLCNSSDAELGVRRQQLSLYHAQREREVIEEIRATVQMIWEQVEVVVLVQRRAESWQAKVRELEEKETKGLGSFAETADARGEWLRARRKVVEEFITLQRLHVRLRQAQGILPLECPPGSPSGSALPHCLPVQSAGAGN
jgi:hypothetical protein